MKIIVLPGDGIGVTALAEVGYNGFATSEVGGGGREVLADIAARMKKVLELS